MVVAMGTMVVAMGYNGCGYADGLCPHRHCEEASGFWSHCGVSHWLKHSPAYLKPFSHTGKLQP